MCKLTLRHLAAPLAMAVLAAAGSTASAASLGFQVHEGLNLNLFKREGAVSAHLVLRDGTTPRLLVAFPAGNSGVGAWFAPNQTPVRWRVVSPLRPLLLRDAHGRPLHGISVDIEVDAPELRLDRAVLGSVRVLRDFQALHTAPTELDAQPRRNGQRISWARDRLDGAPGYLLSLELLDGEAAPGPTLEWQAKAGRPLRLRLVAASGETPLTPLDAGDILTASEGRDARARQSLAFLSYREKLLAGSWRFDTYFGRDTLMSVRLLLPVLKAEEAEAGLGAVLARLSAQGEVAHEEDIGEYAVMDNIKAGRGPVDTPVYDYKMIDADFMLAPVVQAYAERFGTARLRAFLTTRAPSGQSYGKLLVRNLDHVVHSASPFAALSSPANLIHLKPGYAVGQWRDSETGLAGGRIPYDVNAVFVPAALSAVTELKASGALSAYLPAPDAFSQAGRLAALWRRQAAPLFQVHVDPAAARTAVQGFAATAGVDARPALASVPGAGLDFEALSLDGTGRPIPVLNSDIGFELLFGAPTPDAVARIVDSVMRPFPAGLMTGVGPVVADAAFAAPAIEVEFSKAAYHGAVVWAWQEAVLIAGLDRQLARSDLPAGLRPKLEAARDRLWTAVQAVGDTRTSELWSWSFEGGRYRVEAFGAGQGDADESNAAQLWSTVFLALGPKGAHAR
jgi:hypothetical protein